MLDLACPPAVTTTWSWRSPTGRPPARRRTRRPGGAPNGLGADARHDWGARWPPASPRHSYAVLRGLTSAPAAWSPPPPPRCPSGPTGRNYDYRYAWIRDQCYAGQAAAAAAPRPARRRGPVRLRAAARRRPAPAPGLHRRRRPVPDERPSPAGLPGGPVRVGNRVNGQFQLDALRRGCCCSPPRTATGDSTATAGRREMPSTRSRPARRARRRHLGARRPGWAHCRLICAAGLRAVAAAEAGGPGATLGGAGRPPRRPAP